MSLIANAASSLQHGPEVASAGVIDVRRRQGESLPDDLSYFSNRCLKIEKTFGIFLRELGNFLDCFLGIVVKD